MVISIMPWCPKTSSWRRVFAFPELLSKEMARLLDTLEELVPFPADERRREAFRSWLARGVEMGVLHEVERELALEGARLRLHEEPDPMYLAMFAHGDDDLLYEEAARERRAETQAALPKGGERFRLSDDRKFVEIQKTGKRTGLVLLSNFLPKGTEVRSRVNWPFAVRPRNSWSDVTLVSPRTLEILSAPSRRAA